MYNVLSSLISLSASKESEMFLLTGSHEQLQGLEKEFVDNENSATQLGRINTHTAHTCCLEYTFQSTQLGLVFSLARAVQIDPIGVTTQSGFLNWGYDPIGEP